MLRLHLSEKIIIPLSVMFRFFPTVMDEAASINAAMRMRGIYMGGKNVGKMLEYRLVPLMTCCVKIGEELSAAALTRGEANQHLQNRLSYTGLSSVCSLSDPLCGLDHGEGSMIEIKKVSFQHENAEKPSLKNVSLTIAEGECVLLCGESGKDDRYPPDQRPDPTFL